MKFPRCSGGYMPAWNDAIPRLSFASPRRLFFLSASLPSGQIAFFFLAFTVVPLTRMRCCSPCFMQTGFREGIVLCGRVRYAAPRRGTLFLGPPCPGSRRAVINNHSLPLAVCPPARCPLCILCVGFVPTSCLLAVCLCPPQFSPTPCVFRRI